VKKNQLKKLKSIEKYVEFAIVKSTMKSTKINSKSITSKTKIIEYNTRSRITIRRMKVSLKNLLEDQEQLM
jgi:hypothetical protein